MNSARPRLPQFSDRLPLGATGLSVSPLCLGITGDERTVLAAYEMGVNFFFLSADLHWPLYEYTRRGLSRLFMENRAAREQVVVGVVSYLSQPLFEALQFHEVVDAVAGLRWVDLLLAGAVSGNHDCAPRLVSLATARARGHVGARTIGATFHSRRHALLSLNSGSIDLGYLRYNPRHPGALMDVFPYLQRPPRSLAFGFKSTMFHVQGALIPRLGLNAYQWRPTITDHYRFALSSRHLQGVLASPMRPTELVEIHDALASGALWPEEQQYMIQLSGTVYPKMPALAHAPYSARSP